MLLSLIAPRWLSLHGLFTVTCVLVYVVTTHVLQQRRHPSAAIGWVLFMLLLPYAALPLYLLFGTRELARSGGSRAHTPANPRGADASAWPTGVTAALPQPPGLWRDFVEGLVLWIGFQL